MLPEERVAPPALPAPATEVTEVAAVSEKVEKENEELPKPPTQDVPAVAEEAGPSGCCGGSSQERPTTTAAVIADPVEPESEAKDSREVEVLQSQKAALVLRQFFCMRHVSCGRTTLSLTN